VVKSSRADWAAFAYAVRLAIGLSADSVAPKVGGGDPLPAGGGCVRLGNRSA
jgi:hypothetical protein